MPHSPWPFQSAAIAQLRRNFATGTRRQLLVSPTGSGKTTIAAILIDAAVRKGFNVWFIAHRLELINQCSKRLDSHSVDHGIIQGNHPRWKPWLPVQVVSVMTAVRRLGSSQAKPNLIIVDEAHRSPSKSYIDTLEAFPDAANIGLTATPWRLDGRPLDDIYEKLVLAATPQQLIDQGYLLAPRVYAPSAPDLSGVKKLGGDYQNGELFERMKSTTIVGDVVNHWKRLVQPSGNPLTALFAVNKAHAEMMATRFRDEGIPAASLDESTPAADRKRMLSDLSTGVLKVLANCQILTEGWDLPHLGCVQLCRPTKSLALYLQMVGRVMRASDGKTECLALDHAGCVHEHGLPQDERDYSLDAPAKTPDKKETDGPPLTTCKECFAIYESRMSTCPECGHEREVKERKISEDSEQRLEEMTPAKLAALKLEKARQIPWITRRMTLAVLMNKAHDKRYKLAWAFFQYSKKIGQWPPKAMQSEAMRYTRLTEKDFDYERESQPSAAEAAENVQGVEVLATEHGDVSERQESMDPIWDSRDG